MIRFKKVETRVLKNQEKIEDKLAQIHLQEGSLLLYEVTST